MRRFFWKQTMRFMITVLALMVVGKTWAKAPTAPTGIEAYAAVLAQVVDDQGMVDYASLAKDPAALNAYVDDLARLAPQADAKWSKAEKIAFWINTYNALVLITVIRQHFDQASGTAAPKAPGVDIHAIAGIAFQPRFEIMGKTLTLEEIKDQILREQFHEPRIHMALVRGDKGSPRLLNEPYAGKRLSEQLDNQTVHFLGRPDKFMLDPGRKTVRLSMIFKWYGSDFEKDDGSKKKATQFSKSERAVLNFIGRHSDASVREWLDQEGYSIQYLEYDVSRNAQAAVPGK